MHYVHSARSVPRLCVLFALKGTPRYVGYVILILCLLYYSTRYYRIGFSSDISEHTPLIDHDSMAQGILLETLYGFNIKGTWLRFRRCGLQLPNGFMSTFDFFSRRNNMH